MLKKILALVGLTITLNANADMVDLFLQGHVSSMDAELSDYYTENESVDIWLSYNSDQPGYTDTYNYIIKDLIITVGDKSFSASNSENSMFIQNNAPADEFIVPYIDVDGLNIYNLDLPQFYLNFVDYSASLYNDQNLPTEFPDLDYWDDVFAFVSYEDRQANASRRLNFEITNMSVQVSPVPVPAAAWLFGSALIGLASLKRKSQ